MKERDEKKRMSIIIISFGQFFRQYPCTKNNGLKLYRTLIATLHFSLFNDNNAIYSDMYYHVRGNYFPPYIIKISIKKPFFTQVIFYQGFISRCVCVCVLSFLNNSKEKSFRFLIANTFTALVYLYSF